ncbi:hypothetical protein FAF44_38815 [Nonomuraea sp. MG754425]|uniref:hypothetical protein n=1 Tax=Nonomuraea sp. MG754425 TaxID=2570319 RepID=UPI001F213203|nr:hypothetical protein [Nonomuraea sp. MG754425]MCF6474291.1 hypothetical protein [Nonomuraea sp. MG754425]
MAIGWTGLYVASKIVYALEGRLGVTGGPVVSPDSYLAYGVGEVALAQWANAGSGALVMAVLLAGRLRLGARRRSWRRPDERARRWTSRLLPGAHRLCAAMAAIGAVGMLGGALLTDRGGALFGGYCAVWATLLVLATRDLPRHGTDHPSTVTA